MIKLNKQRTACEFRRRLLLGADGKMLNTKLRGAMFAQTHRCRDIRAVFAFKNSPKYCICRKDMIK